MTAIKLETSIKKIEKTYIGMDMDGNHQLDPSKLDSLEFEVALKRITMAIENNEISLEEFFIKLGVVNVIQ